MTHDPFRAGQRLPAVQPIAAEPVEGACSILAYVDRYPPFVNAGAEWMLHAMLRDSARRGHRVMVATGCVASEHEVEGVEVHPAGRAPELAAQADVVVGHLLWTNEAIRLAGGARLALLYLVHNDNQVRYWRLNSHKVSGYVWNSEWIAGRCAGGREAAGVPGVVVRPPLVLADYAVTDPAPADRPFVTLVNPIVAKGADLFYELAEAEYRRRFLAVEGAYGSQRRPQREHANVEWQRQTGAFRDDVLARSRVLLMPSSYESWGRAAVEALAAGIPVIASPTPGLREALGANWPLFAPFGDVAAWRSQLAALDDPAAYAAATTAALARADELAAIGAADLAAWDRLVRRAAGGSLAAMAGHDPFRARSAAPAEQPAALVGAAKTQPRLRVPANAADVVAWIGNARDAEQRRARADAAWAVEAGRKGGPRKTVGAAVAAAISAA